MVPLAHHGVVVGATPRLSSRSSTHHRQASQRARGSRHSRHNSYRNTRWRRRSAVGEAAAPDDGGAAEEVETPNVWEARRRNCADEVVRAMLYGGASGGGGESAGGGKNNTEGSNFETRLWTKSPNSNLVRLPLPDARVPRTLLNLAAAAEPSERRSSSPSAAASTARRALRDALSRRRVRVPDVDGALCERCELTPGDRRSGARRLGCRAACSYLARLFLIAGGVDASSSASERDSSSRRSSSVRGVSAADGAATDEDNVSRLNRFDLFHGERRLKPRPESQPAPGPSPSLSRKGARSSCLSRSSGYHPSR